jgi:hypothetical protein
LPWFHSRDLQRGVCGGHRTRDASAKDGDLLLCEVAVAVRRYEVPIVGFLKLAQPLGVSFEAAERLAIALYVSHVVG